MLDRDVTVLAAARRHLGLVLVATTLGLGAAVGVIAFSPTTYTSSTEMYVSITPEAASDHDLFGSLPFVESRSLTYASLVGKQSFQEAVAAA